MQNDGVVKCKNPSCTKKVHLACTPSLNGFNEQSCKLAKLMVINNPRITAYYQCENCESAEMLLANNLAQLIEMNRQLLEKSDEMLNKMKSMEEEINGFNNIKHEVAVIPSIVEKINAIEKLLKDEGVKNAEATTKIDEKLEKICGGELPWNEVVKETKKKIVATPGVIMKPKDKNAKREELTKALKQNIDENQFKIIGARNSSSNAMVIDVKDVESQSKLIEEASKKMGTNFVFKAMPTLRPRIKILNVVIPIEQSEQKNEIDAYLKSKNEPLKDAKLVLAVAREKTAEQACFDVIMEVDSKTYNYYMEGKPVKSLWHSSRVVEGIRVKMCFKCLRYGHQKKDCDQVLSCAKCGANHLANNCNADEIKCVNCERANVFLKRNKHDSNHSALSKDCPCFKIQHDRLLKLVKFE
jgi:hypothetical protein